MKGFLMLGLVLSWPLGSFAASGEFNLHKANPAVMNKITVGRTVFTKNGQSHKINSVDLDRGLVTFEVQQNEYFPRTEQARISDVAVPLGWNDIGGSDYSLPSVDSRQVYIFGIFPDSRILVQVLKVARDRWSGFCYPSPKSKFQIVVREQIKPTYTDRFGGCRDPR